MALKKTTFLSALALFPSLSHAEFDTSAYISLTTNYIYRGLSFTGDTITPRANFSITHDSGLFFNTWVARDDISGLFGDDERHDTEFEFNLGYHWQFDNPWSFTFSHAWLEYNQVHQPRNHDYRELRAHLHYKDHLTFFASHTGSAWNTGSDLVTLSVIKRKALPYSTLAEAELGFVTYSDVPDTDYLFTRLSLGKAWNQHIVTSLEYSYSQSDADNAFDSDRTGNQVSFTLGYHF